MPWKVEYGFESIDVDALLKRAEAAEAERDALKATVEKIRAMALAPRWLTDVRGEGHNACYSQNILNVLPALAGEK